MISLTSPARTWAHRIPAGVKLLALSGLTMALFLLDAAGLALAVLLSKYALCHHAGSRRVAALLGLGLGLRLRLLPASS